MAATAQRKTTPKKATASTRKKAAPRTAASDASSASAPAADATANGHKQRTGPVLGAYRLSLSALETVTVGVGGLALGSLSKLGLPKGAANAMKNTHAGAIRGATKASDVVGTKAAKVVGKTVAVGSSAAKYVFPE